MAEQFIKITPDADETPTGQTDKTLGIDRPGNELRSRIGEDKGLMAQMRSSASEVLDNATAKATDRIQEQKSNISAGLSNVASGIRDLGNNLATSGSENHIARITSEASSTAAKKIEGIADYFDQHDLNAIYHDVEALARRNPAIFFGGAFALGFLAARFLKSSNPPRFSAAAAQPFKTAPERPRMSGEAARGL
jgi:hypothetical protein